MKPRIAMTVCLIAILALTALGSASSPRFTSAFNTGWKFLPRDSSDALDPTTSDTSWQTVSLPHDWNAKDVVPGNKMFIGAAWYRKTFSLPNSWEGKRVFIRFGAASLSADIYLNGQRLGSHQGGFAAFCFEMSPLLILGKPNVLAVRIDNHRGQISPLGGDFSVPGGLYRSVEVIVTDPIDITPLDHASSGVFAKQEHVSASQASLEVTSEVSNGTVNREPIQIVTDLFDAHGRSAVHAESNQVVEPGPTSKVEQHVTIHTPHLWDGVRDPYLYRLRVSLNRAGKCLDQVEQSIGFRSYSFDPQKGFILNGKPMQIHGVDLHQDGGEHGWAVTPQDEARDLRLAREMGVDGLRLAHYQHSDHFHDLCDRAGVVVWSELAVVNDLSASDEFRENVHEQLRELIRQNFNHPSIVIWSMYNEIASKNKAKPGPFIKDLSDIAHKEDPSRPTTGAASGDTMWNLPDVMNELDLVSLNLYPGWYGGKLSDLGSQIDRFNTRYGAKGLSVSEYGGGASVKQHEDPIQKQPVPGSRWHPEEYQALLHEQSYRQIQQRPFVWGSFVWVMFDFPSKGRHEGDTDGINDKGLVTRDRKTRKDAYYFYRSHWTTRPMVYITGRRFTLRTSPLVDIKLYSNCSLVKLSVNGHPYPLERQPDDRIWIAKNVQLIPGDNIVEAAADSGTVTDACHWTLQTGSIR